MADDNEEESDEVTLNSDKITEIIDEVCLRSALSSCPPGGYCGADWAEQIVLV